MKRSIDMHLRWPHIVILFLLLVVAFACDSAGEHGHDEHGHEAHGEEGHDNHGKENHDDHADKEHDEDEERVVYLSPEALSRSGIRVGVVETGALSDTLNLPAEIQLNPDRVAHISPLVEGQLLDVTAKVGQTLDAGTQMATLRSVALGQARADLAQAGALRSVARKTFERQKKLRNSGISSERSFLEAQLAFEQANIERRAAASRLQVFGITGGVGPDMALTSPIHGLVLERHATRGENVTPEDVLFIVADMGRVWVIGRVYERQIARVRPGLMATLTLTAYPGRTWQGKVDFAASSLDEDSRTLAVRVELDNPEGLLRPGLFGNLRLEASNAATKVPLAPEAAIQELHGKSVIFQPDTHKAGTFQAVPITVGRTDAGMVEIIKGLESGQPIVTEGAFVLKSELMRAQLGHGHAH